MHEIARRIFSPRGRVLIFAVVLTAVTILAYRPAWHGGFLWDDDDYIIKNELLTAPDGWQRIWFSLDSPSQYFPFTYSTFRIERALWGLNTTGYHWVNLLLHIGNALLVWAVLARLRLPGSWLAAAIFALHPVQVESVAWITERKNVLMGFFFLLTLLAWIAFVDERTRRPWLFYCLALVCYVLALSAKATACTLPAALFLILWLQKKPITVRRVIQILPFVVLGIGMGLLAVWWERYHQGTNRGLFTFLSPIERILLASRAIWFYLSKIFWPSNLTFIYPRWNISPANLIDYIWLVAGIAACVVICFLRRYVGRGVEGAAAFFVATLSPVLGFVMLFTFRYTFVADHYQYLACIGPIALVSGLVIRLSGSMEVGERTLGILICVALGVLTWQQSGSYRDIETLWLTTIDRNPGCWMAEHNLGGKLLEKRDLDGAIAHFERAVQLKYDNSESHYGMADALRRKGDVERAMTEAQISLDLRPGDPETHVVLGMAFMTKGQVDEAATHFSKAIEIRPNYSTAHYNLAIALLDKHESGKAIEHYEKAIELQPDFLEALTNLAWIFANYPDATVRNASKAVELAENANQFTGGTDPNVLRTLAAAYASNKSFDKALETSRRALQFAQDQRDFEATEAIRREMSFYARGQPPYRAD